METREWRRGTKEFQIPLCLLSIPLPVPIPIFHPLQIPNIINKEKAKALISPFPNFLSTPTLYPQTISHYIPLYPLSIHLLIQSILGRKWRKARNARESGAGG